MAKAMKRASGRTRGRSRVRGKWLVKRSGKSGRYFSVLNWLSEKGLSSLTCGLLWNSVRAKCGQQLRDSLRSHGCATVAANLQLITADALLDERLANHFCGGMLELVASLADLLIGVEDTVHRSDGTEMCPLIQQFRVGMSS